MTPMHEEIIRKLTKRFYLKITEACLELSPKIEHCLEVRGAIISNLKRLIDTETMRGG